MDEVHIAQFAALLRTLSKSHNRQIILAVHERSLFEYPRFLCPWIELNAVAGNGQCRQDRRPEAARRRKAGGKRP
jgi:hypothetical protein